MATVVQYPVLSLSLIKAKFDFKCLENISKSNKILSQMKNDQDFEIVLRLNIIHIFNQIWTETVLTLR